MKLHPYAALMCGILALAGCDAATFASANQALASTSKLAASAGRLAAPTAAVAAGLGTLAVAQALAGDLDRPGAYRLAATETTIDVADAGSAIDLHVTYRLTTAADGTMTAAVTALTGTVQGYAADAAGSLVYTPTAAGGLSFEAAFDGQLASGTNVYALKDLTLGASYPMPARAATLGACTVSETRAGVAVSELAATLAIDATGKLELSGDLTRDGVTTPVTDFSQALAG